MAQGDAHFSSTSPFVRHQYVYYANNRLTKSITEEGSTTTTADYYYDHNGNQITKAVNVTAPQSGVAAYFMSPQTNSYLSMYEYDSYNRLKSADTDGTVTTYTYDGNNLRQSKASNGITTQHIWDGSNMVMDGTNKFYRGINFTNLILKIKRKGDGKMRIRKTITSLFVVFFMCCTVLSNFTAYAASTTRTMFIDADISINISSYTPTVSGTIACVGSKVASVSVTNITNNNTIYSETITSEDGIHDVSFTLPSLINPKKYKFDFVCTDGNKTLSNMSVVIDSAILLVDITGNVSTAEDVEIDAGIESTNTGLVNKSMTFTGSEEVSVDLPNLLASASFHLTAKGYEIATVEDSDNAILTTNIENIDGKVSVTGNISTGAGQWITILARDSEEKIIYINQIASGYDGQFTIEFKVPEYASVGVSNVKMRGEKTNSVNEMSFVHSAPTPTPPTIEVQSTCSVVGTTNDEFRIVVSAQDVASADTIYTITYDSDVVTPTSLFGFGYDDVLQPGVYGNVNILSHTEGVVRFKLVDIPQNSSWSGVVNVLKFKFLSENTGTTDLTLGTE